VHAATGPASFVRRRGGAGGPYDQISSRICVCYVRPIVGYLPRGFWVLFVLGCGPTFKIPHKSNHLGRRCLPNRFSRSRHAAGPHSSVWRCSYEDISGRERRVPPPVSYLNSAAADAYLSAGFRQPQPVWACLHPDGSLSLLFIRLPPHFMCFEAAG